MLRKTTNLLFDVFCGFVQSSKLNSNHAGLFASIVKTENVFGVLFELCVVLKQTNSKCASTYVEQS